MNDDDLVANRIAPDSEGGFFLMVHDFRPETLRFMEEQDLQGGGPTWMALLVAALEIESPATLPGLEFDDEADDVVVRSPSEGDLKTVQTYAALLMTDPDFMLQCIRTARDGGYLE